MDRSAGFFGGLSLTHTPMAEMDHVLVWGRRHEKFGVLQRKTHLGDLCFEPPNLDLRSWLGGLSA